MDLDLDNEILALADKGSPNNKKKRTLKRGRKKVDSDDEFFSDDNESSEYGQNESFSEAGDDDDEMDHDASSSEDEEDAEVKTWGPDLIGDENDRRRLIILTEIEREGILSERAERRQAMLERQEIKRKLKEGQNKKTVKTSHKNKLAELAKKRTVGRKLTETKQYKDDYSSSPEPEEVKITLEDISSIVLTRDQLEKWCFSPFFEDVVEKCFVRLGLGVDPSTQKRVYRLVMITDVVDHDRTYKIGNNLARKALELKHGKAKKVFTMESISNSAVTETEFNRFVTTMQKENQKLISHSEIEGKKKDIDYAKSYVLTNEDLQNILEAKKALNNTPANIAAEKIELMRAIDIAKSQNDEAKTRQLQKQLEELDEHAEQIRKEKENNRLKMLAELNAKNRRRNVLEAREAELKAMNKKKMLGISEVEYIDVHGEALKRRQSLFKDFSFAKYKTVEDVLDAFDLNRIK